MIKRNKKIFLKFLGIFSCFFGLLVVGCKKEDSDPLSWLNQCIYKNFNTNGDTKIYDIISKDFNNTDFVLYYKDSSKSVQSLTKSDFKIISNVYFDTTNPYSILSFENNYFVSNSDSVSSYFFLISLNIKSGSLNINLYLPMVVILKGNYTDLSNNNSYQIATKKIGTEDNPLISKKNTFDQGSCLKDNWYSLLL